MILAISGSLRRSSVNSAALGAAATVAARTGLVVTVDDTVRQLPHFDPDLEASPPEAVLRFWAVCDAAAGVLLSVPEYAFGIPGAFKNALDWTVGSTCLHRKPVTVLDVAHPDRGQSVRTALGLVLKALNADVVFRSVPITTKDRDVAGEIIDPGIVEQLRAIVADLDDRATAAASLRSRSGREEVFAR
jgi:chromate reductase, NAD(P)H dehydrogenase (quinone)